MDGVDSTEHYENDVIGTSIHDVLQPGTIDDPGILSASASGLHLEKNVDDLLNSGSSVLNKLKPGKETYRITTMKGLFLRSVLYSRYYYNLTCEASWVVETGSSKTQDKSRIVNSILPFIMQCCTPEDIAVLSICKPDPSSKEYDTWNNNLMSKAAEIEQRLQKQLEDEEDVYFPSRDKSKLRRKHMYVNGVDSRLADIRRVKGIKNSKLMSSFCSSAGSILPNSSSSSSTSANISNKKTQELNLITQQNVMSAFIRK